MKHLQSQSNLILRYSYTLKMGKLFQGDNKLISQMKRWFPSKSVKFYEDCIKNLFLLGTVHKLRQTLRGGGGRRSVTLCDKGWGRDPKFCDIFQK